ncbi:MAG: OsmC family protein [Microbacteriaceae bacterium]
MNREHRYEVFLRWQGNTGSGTSDYRSYRRTHLLSAEGKHDIQGSADHTFHGDKDRWNPEELLIGALAQCHMLSYLHSAAANGIVVTAYEDTPTGTLQQTANDGGHFTSVTLRPRVTITDPAQREKAVSLHADASRACFIAASVNFPVGHEPEIIVEQGSR